MSTDRADNDQGQETQPPSRRTRMSPASRREFLLDTARSIIERDGLDALTIERLARSSAVSEQLVFHYFGTRAAILSEVLSRELTRYNEVVEKGLLLAVNFEDVVRVYCAANFDHRAASSVIAYLLADQQTAAAADDQLQADSQKAARVLAEHYSEAYGAGNATAEFALTVGSAASIAAAGLAARRGLNREAAIDQTMRFVMAGIHAVAS